MNKFKFSIIVPNYNSGKYIRGCIESIISDQYDNFELFIVDGKSLDDSHSIILQYKDNAKVHWIKEPDRGISNAFNLALNHCTWDFILYLWSDDYLYPGILSKVNIFLNNITNYSAPDFGKVNIFCDSINYYYSENRTEKRVYPTIDINRENLIKYWTIIPLQSIFLNKEWIKSNKLDENYKYTMDYELYFRMIESQQIFLHLPEISNITWLWDNISCNNWNKWWFESLSASNLRIKTLRDFLYSIRRWLLQYYFHKIFFPKW